ncbi:holo-ACP synthase [Mesorhizobium montanum]|uniref:holo-ACP synthase n=1 Tax=Mesorhizobium montanum TaxID=3072323 RepID=UPI003D315D43
MECFPSQFVLRARHSSQQSLVEGLNRVWAAAPSAHVCYEASVIIGVGIDLCRIERVRRSVDQLGDAWLSEVFTTKERRQYLGVADMGFAFARGFACKEACAKALGCGFSGGVQPRDICISDVGNCFHISLQGPAWTRLRRMAPPKHVPKFQIDVAIFGPYLSCTVIIEGVAI